MPDEPPPPDNPPGWAAPGGPPPTPPGWSPPSAPGPAGPYGQPSYGPPPYSQPPYSQPPYGQPPYGQPPYGQVPPVPPYGGGAWGYGYAAPQNDKGATTALVLGLVGLLCCALAGPFAIYEGTKSRRRIRESNGYLTGDGMAMAGVILGAVAIGLWIIIILFSVVVGGTGTTTNG
jgi:Domain of unknown function (DUF4190)